MAAPFIHPNLLKPVASGYAVANKAGLADPILAEIAEHFEGNYGRKMINLAPSELPKQFGPSIEVLCSEKYDGEGIFVHFQTEDVDTPERPEIFAFNAGSGRVRVGLPALKQMAAMLKARNVKRGLFRAELYLPADAATGRRRGTAEVTSHSLTGGDDQVSQLRIAVINVVMLDGKDWRIFQNRCEMIWNQLADLFGDDTSKPVHRIAGEKVSGAEVERYFNTVTRGKGEGLVIRSLTETVTYKVKPKFTIDAAVIGYVEGEFEGMFGIRSLLCALTYTVEPQHGNERFFQTFVRVYSGMDDRTAQELLGRLQPLKVEAPLAMTDSEGRLIHFVKPGMIVELEGDEITNLKGGNPFTTALFAWDHKKESWRFHKETAASRLTFPTFLRVRDDKTIAADGARIDQIVSGARADSAPGKPSAPPRIVLRRVWTKVSKGETAVKKLLVIERSEPNFPPFVITASDFSATRKDRLKADCQIAFTSARKDALVQAFLTEEIKKGWEEVAAK